MGGRAALSQCAMSGRRERADDRVSSLARAVKAAVRTPASRAQTERLSRTVGEAVPVRLAGLAPQPITASASISSTYAGSISAEICTMLVAGRISSKTSL